MTSPNEDSSSEPPSPGSTADPDDEGSPPASGRTIDLDRRRVLKLAGGGALGAGAARVGYEVTGYGLISGTNLPNQRLAPLARRRLRPRPFDLTLSEHRMAFDGERLSLEHEASGARTTVPIRETTPKAAAEAGAEFGLEGPLRELATDLDAIAAGDVSFEFSGYRGFFDRIRETEPRPFTVAALRGGRHRRPSAETVRRFTGSDPADPASLVTGLAAGFREHAHFDVVRYLVGSIQDHLLFGTVPLRRYVAEPTGFDALLDGSTGLYCWEYTYRSIEAFHAAPPHRQSPPVFGAIVVDDRHNHMFTGLASAVRDSGELRVPMTFLDYSHSTMYDTYRLRWLFGEGVDAYNDHHRASAIRYSR